MDVTRLSVLGQAMFGTRWQSDLARAVGVTPRDVRFWVAGSRAIPAVVGDRIEALARERAGALWTLVRPVMDEWVPAGEGLYEVTGEEVA